MKKTYSVADFHERLERGRLRQEKQTTRKEDIIINMLKNKAKKCDDMAYYRSPEKRKKQLRAEKGCIPLWVWNQ